MSSSVDGSHEIPVEVVIASQPPPILSAARTDRLEKKEPTKESADALNKPDAVPYHFRTFAVPVTAANSSEAINYQFVVGGMLERAKQYPESAIRRGAKGTSTIEFVLDETGAVASVSLLRSSGEADLDSESVALVRRAAPFPPPPPGVKRSFAIKVAFGTGR
jgi:periplasmic protein TonB